MFFELFDILNDTTNGIPNDEFDELVTAVLNETERVQDAE